MKTPDEIKDGLKQCSISGAHCDCCPYDRDNGEFDQCILNMCADSLAYIQQLEEQHDFEPENHVLKGNM